MPTKSYFLLNPSPLQTLPICWSPFKGCALSSAPPLLLSSSSSSLTQTLSLMAPLTNLLPSFLIRIIILLVIYTTSSLSISETDILIKFKDTIGNNGALSNWNPLTPPCSDKSYKWAGVLCQKGKVWGLKLEKMGLVGSLELEPLKDISSLRFLSFENNDFQGSFPKVKVLSSLKTAFFSHNKFSGELPADAFSGMMSLKKLHLAYNQFSGHIPVSLTQLNKLMEATLENNKFKGEIPDFKQQNIQLNVSSNKLEGPIPGSLSKMNKNSFSGNEGLCGAPLEPCSSKKPSLIIIIAISVVVVVVILAILLGVTILCKLKKRPQRDTETPPLEASVCKTNPVNGGGESPNVNPQQVAAKLTFLREEREIFDMHDLLKASAEILGGGKFGSTYKAALSVGSVMVVRRFKHMNNVGKEEFQEHMRRLGRLRQSNLLPLVAFYYRKEEKLLVSDYVNNVSLAVHLHGKNCKGQTVSIDWQTRLKIVKGVARALFYLYNELPSITVPHGHLKSSNVLLDESFEPLLTDYGLVPVVNQEHAKEVMTAYKSPEFKQHGRITRKMDIWSLGILILEILTGKIPAYSKQQQGKGDESKDLETWAQSVNQEELNVEMLDKEMLRGNRNCEGEMIKLLKIGFSCCEADVTKRWDIKDVVEKIEELRERDGDDDFYSSYASEGDLLSKNLK